MNARNDKRGPMSMVGEMNPRGPLGATKETKNKNQNRSLVRFEYYLGKIFDREMNPHLCSCVLHTFCMQT